MDAAAQPQQGALSWRLSSHPITLLTFLGFRICWYRLVAACVAYTNGPFLQRACSYISWGFGSSRACAYQPFVLFPSPVPSTMLVSTVFTDIFANRIMIFIITILLLACDFYYLKNIAGRRLVGLRWWNEVDPSTGDSQWVFESLEPGTRQINSTDSRFFWLALYIQPLWWILMAILAIIRLQFLWLPLVGESNCHSFF